MLNMDDTYTTNRYAQIGSLTMSSVQALEGTKLGEHICISVREEDASKAPPCLYIS
jgi:hypothetical protein